MRSLTEEQRDELTDVIGDEQLIDEVTIALDICGWMIVPKPEFADGRRWFLNHPSVDCPDWCDNGHENRYAKFIGDVGDDLHDGGPP